MLLLTPHRTGVAVVLAAGLVLAGGRPASAQKEFQIYYQMQAMNEALGVGCVY